MTIKMFCGIVGTDKNGGQFSAGPGEEIKLTPEEEARYVAREQAEFAGKPTAAQKKRVEEIQAADAEAANQAAADHVATRTGDKPRDPAEGE